jgi:TonB family protein
MYRKCDVHSEERQSAACRTTVEGITQPLAQFRGAVRSWSDRASVKDRAAELHWMVIPATDHLARLLPLSTLDVPWYRSLWSGLRELLQPAPPPLDLTSKPVLVREIWGQYGRQKKSWVMSVALQSAAVLALFSVAMAPPVQRHVGRFVGLVPPDVSEYLPKVAAASKDRPQGGGGGGDRSPLPPARGRLPEFSRHPFVPPMQVVANLNPKWSMDPTLLGDPDIKLPNVNMDQFGDPLAKLGPASNGPGTNGGIGTGDHGGIGPGHGIGYGPGDNGNFGGGPNNAVFRVGLGVTAPALLYKVEPEYSEEARKAKYQGTVLLYVEVDPSGHATSMKVIHSLGLSLDEKAMEAVNQWKFRPGMKDGKPVTVAATIEVNFRLL